MNMFKYLFQFLSLLILSLLFTHSAIAANTLKNHASPYLAMHGDDPVNWMKWDSEALLKAQQENKLLFVSIGYYACHWCHVMHRESYSNEKIAQKLNQHYIAVKVDRELNPVLDKRLIEFVNATTGSAGWPLNVFLTPEGYPLVGATYIPPKSFSSALTDLSHRWKKNHSSMTAEAKMFNQRFIAAMEQQEQTEKTQTIATLKQPLLNDIMAQADALAGGFGDQTKFPSIAQLHALFNLNQQEKNPEIDHFIKLTLDVMANKGLHDEVGGGFYRYTTDPDWHTPHFEKMLYTNALLPILYLEAADYYHQQTYRDTGLETLYFLKDSMKHHQYDAFIASLSAVDKQGIEGGFYLWTQSELKKILTPAELKLANIAWKMNRANEHKAGNLPLRQESVKMLAIKLGITQEAVMVQLNGLKNKLKMVRNNTRHIPKDTKLLTSWNGMVLAAFASAIKTDDTFKPTGQALAQFLIQQWNGKQLQRSNSTKQEGTLSDYAAAAWGLVSWGRANNNKQALQIGTAIAQSAWTNFYHNGKWQETRQNILPKGVQQSHLTDSAYPSAETLLLHASYLTNNDELKRKSDQVVNHASKSVKNNPYSYASLISIAVMAQKKLSDLKTK